MLMLYRVVSKVTFPPSRCTTIQAVVPYCMQFSPTRPCCVNLDKLRVVHAHPYCITGVYHANIPVY